MCSSDLGYWPGALLFGGVDDEKLGCIRDQTAALRMQQDLEDKKHEVIIENLENKIKDQTTAFEKKEFELQITEGLLEEAEAKITELNTKLLYQLEGFEQEKLKLNEKLEAEIQNGLVLKNHW